MSLIDPRVWGAALIVLLVTAGGCYVKGRMDGRALATTEAQAEQLKAVIKARAEEQREAIAQVRIANEAKQQADQARADAVAANAVAGRLRQRIAELARTGSHPATASGSEAAADPIGVLADMLSRADERAGSLAEYADAARIAGAACERSYEALIPNQ